MRAPLLLMFPSAALSDGPFAAFYPTHGEFNKSDITSAMIFFSEAVVAQRKISRHCGADDALGAVRAMAIP